MASSGSRRRHGAALALAGACVALAACAEVEDRPASWSFVHAVIVAPNCTSSNCHSQLAATAGLQLDELEGAYFYLTGRPCDPGGTGGELTGDHNFVLPGQPESSRLVHLLRGKNTIVMPPDVPLPEAEIEIIERWILEGAECN